VVPVGNGGNGFEQGPLDAGNGGGVGTGNGADADGVPPAAPPAVSPAHAPPPKLPKTGGDSDAAAGMAGVGALLILAGAAISRGRHRRSD